MIIKRVFTTEGQNVFDTVKWKKVNVKITNSETNEVIINLKDLEFPEQFSQNACDIIAKMYFRKQGVPNTNHETSFKQVVTRMVNFWILALIDEKLINEDQKQILFDELAFTLIHQMWAPNSPQWFNTGLYHAYGIEDNSQELFYYDEKDQAVKTIDNNYKRTQGSACFIVNIEDSLFGSQSIMDHLQTATKLFRFGSGIGSNWSKLRGKGEPLSNGGYSSGVMSFLKVFDVNAGVIKSGGTTRRSAVMNILDEDHPDIVDFIKWKADEETKVFQFKELGYPIKLNGGAYDFVSGQNVNNSILLSDQFMRDVMHKRKILLKNRTNKEVTKKINAEELFSLIAESAWRCGDPGVQFKDRINEFNTCRNDGEIVASNPCSEYLFLNDTSCNLASINILKLYDFDQKIFKLDEYKQLITIIQLILEATVHWGLFPTKEIALNTWKYRTTGLGLSNLGALVMGMGFEYGAEKSLNLAGFLSSFLTGYSYYVSSLMAKEIGSFDRFKDNRSCMSEVIYHHQDMSIKYEYTELNFENQAECKEELKNIWEEVLKASSKHGFRNAQVTVMAPTGTIGFAMDCISTSIEPIYSHIIYKKVVDGSMIKVINDILPISLKTLGYSEENIHSIIEQILNGVDISDIWQLNIEDKKVLRTVSCNDPITPEQHVWMVAAITPNISGGISKTINLPNDYDANDIKAILQFAWGLGCKCITVYRDGSKAIQPLSSVSKKTKKKCPVCGSTNLSKSGSCGYCKDCGSSTGCS